MSPRPLAALSIAAVALAGCGAASGPGADAPPAPPTSQASRASTSSASGAPASTQPAAPPRRSGISKLFTIVEENHSLTEMSTGMPYLFGLARRYGYARNYHAVAHPSLPNYLAIAGGSTFGINDDNSPSAHPLHGPSIFGEAIMRGRTARLYAESMPTPCDTEPAGSYAVKHAPWAYFVDERTACQAGMVPAGTPTAGVLARDAKAGQLPNVGMLIPNLDDDAHDGTLAAADGWLRRWLPPLLAGPDFRAGHLAIVVTGDEDDSSQANDVLTVVVAPGVNHEVVNRPLSHYSLTRWYDDVIGAAPLRQAGSALSLGAAFTTR